MTAVSDAVVARVRERDEDRCVRCTDPIRGERGVDWSVHHRRPRGSGGTSLRWVNQPANLIILCGSGVTGCHGWVEKHRAEARDLGFLVRLNGTEPASHVPLEHGLFGRVLLDDFGDKHGQEVVF